MHIALMAITPNKWAAEPQRLGQGARWERAGEGRVRETQTASGPRIPSLLGQLLTYHRTTQKTRKTTLRLSTHKMVHKTILPPKAVLGSNTQRVTLTCKMKFLQKKNSFYFIFACFFVGPVPGIDLEMFFFFLSCSCESGIAAIQLRNNSPIFTENRGYLRNLSKAAESNS